MSVREYIGARYVPVFADPLEWNASNTYEPLTVVLYQGNSYTSMRSVPAGIAITNTSYWAQTGNYNAQIESYRQEVQTLSQNAALSGGSTNTLYDAEQAIAENAADIAELQGVASDSKWQYWTPSSAFTHYSGAVEQRVRKFGPIVELKGVVKPTAQIAANTSTEICTLPAEYRSFQNLRFVCCSSNAAKWILEVREDGKVNMLRYFNGASVIACPANTWLPFSVIYMTPN